MNLHLQNKHILITGGSKGIGLACAGAFLQEGAHVTLVARNSDTLLAAQRELSLTAPAGCKIHVVSADLTQADAALAALAEAEGLGGPI
ncbi:MAG: Gluconate 5-dehydrogenase, partial [Pseudomonadota bacterium]